MDKDLSLPIIEPMQHQKDCLDALSAATHDGLPRALVVMATGLGKTWVAAFHQKQFKAQNPGTRTLYLAHQNQILHQAKTVFAQVSPEQSSGIFNGDEKDFDEKDILFASLQSLRDWHHAFLPDEFDYIAVDEAHHSQAETYKRVVESFMPSFLLGITATPDRHDMRDIRSIFGKEIFELPLHRALAEKLLARTEYRVITDRINYDKVAKAEQGEISLAELNKSLFIPLRDKEIADIINQYSQEVDRPHRIIFCANISHADEMSKYFPNSASLHSAHSYAEKRMRIKSFREGELDTLCVVDMFNEGVDIPETNQIVFLRSTESKTIFYQQLGRGLRKINGKDKVQVLDFVANVERLQYIKELWEETHSEYYKLPQFEEERLEIEIGELDFTHEIVNLLDALDRIENRYGRDKLIADMQQVAAMIGKAPTFRDYLAAKKQNSHLSSTGVYIREFGSWNDAIRHAGYEPNVRKDYTEEELLDMAQSLHIKLDKGLSPLTASDFVEASKRGETASYITFKSVFGSMGNLNKLIGLRANVKQYDKQEVLSNLTNVIEELGYRPTLRQLDELTTELPKSGSIVRMFGGFRIAMDMAVLGVGDPSEFKEGVLNRLREMHDALGHSPSQEEFKDAVKAGKMIPLNQVKILFGTYTEALVEAGLTPNAMLKSSKEDIIIQLNDLAQELGRVPTNKDIDVARKQGKIVSRSVIIHYFESHNELLKAAGLEVNWSPGVFSDDDIKRIYLQVSKDHYDGRSLTRKQFIQAFKDKIIPFGPGIIVKRFGSMGDFYKELEEAKI